MDLNKQPQPGIGAGMNLFGGGLGAFQTPGLPSWAGPHQQGTWPFLGGAQQQPFMPPNPFMGQLQGPSSLGQGFQGMPPPVSMLGNGRR